MSKRRMILALASLLLVPVFAGAQSYPSKPVTIVVPSVAGGNVDALARVIAQPLSQALGQPVIVSNKPGASMTIGSHAVAVASPDGYTLLLGSSTALAMNPVMYRRLSYDPLTQLAPVSLIALQPMAILVHPSVPAQTLPELVALAKAKPRGLFYGATGSSIQLATEYFAAQTGTKFEAVNYKGNAEGLTDLAAGRIQVLFDAVPTSIPFVQSGRARALAVTSRSRSPGLPGVPTVAELGLPAEFDVTLLFALMAPEGTPPEIVQRLNAEMRKVLASAEVKDRLARQGVEPQASTPQQLHDRIRSEIERWRKVVKDADIKIEE